MPRYHVSLLALVAGLAACSEDVSHAPGQDNLLEVQVEVRSFAHRMSEGRRIDAAFASVRNLTQVAICVERPGWGDSEELHFFYPTGHPVHYMDPCDSFDFGLATCPTSMWPYRRIEPGEDELILASNSLHRGARFRLAGSLSFWACDEPRPPGDASVRRQEIDMFFDFPEIELD